MPYTSEKRLYLDADRKRVVEEDDPAAAFLLVAAGGELDDATAAQYGLTTAKTDTATTTPGTPAKAAETPANKARVAPANKTTE